MANLRGALVGCGGMMRHHARMHTQLDGAEMTALCDIVPGQFDAIKAVSPLVKDAACYERFEDMLAQEKLDFVFIATPHDCHAPQVIAALEAGVHVLLEKPIAISVAQAEAMIAARDRSGCTAALAYQRHGLGQFRWLRSQIQSGAFGELRAATCHLGQAWKTGTANTWRQNPAQSGGGMLHDSGSHMIDVAMWMTGRHPVRISAHIDNRDTPVDIQGYVAAVLDNGATLQINVIGDASMWHERHSYWFENASVFIEDDVTRVFHRDGTRMVLDAWPAAEPPLVNFVRALHGQTEIYAPLECGLHVQQVTEGAYRSHAQSGAQVSF